MKARILCVDDDPDSCEALGAALLQMGFTPTTTTSPRVALDLVAKEPPDAVITDLVMDEMDGLSLCERVLGKRPGIPIIVVTARGSMEAAVQAMHAGAYDFLSKPVDALHLQLAVERAARHRHLTMEVERLQEAMRVVPASAAIAGQSPVVERVNDLVRRVAGTDAAVLIQGETGTGKELVARALHDASRRRSGPFVAINCAAIPPQLLESELFGHARGSFTDAKTARQGLFLDAAGGTLFLDEIGEMPLEMQAKLLRVLQEKKVRPVGVTAEVPFDARVLTATHRDLEVEVEARRFRQDLYYRINVVKIDVPPLRDRGSDVLTLAALFLDRAAGTRTNGKVEMSPQVAERLLDYDWPGNVRELENCVERAVALARFDHLTVEDLPERIRRYRTDRFAMSTETEEDILPLAEIEKRYIARVMRLLGGNKLHAAERLGLDRRTLYRKLDRFRSTSAPPESGGMPLARASQHP